MDPSPEEIARHYEGVDEGRRLTVLEMDGRRIAKIRVDPIGKQLTASHAT